MVSPCCCVKVVVNDNNAIDNIDNDNIDNDNVDNDNIDNDNIYIDNSTKPVGLLLYFSEDYPLFSTSFVGF